MQFNSILCPTDFSAASYDALTIAAALAIDTNSELYVIHVSVPSCTALSKEGDTDFDHDVANHADAVRNFTDILDKVLPDHLRVSPILAMGDATREIVNAAKHGGVELIVLTTHGAGDSSDDKAGQVYRSIVESAPCPVLAVCTPRRKISKDPADEQGCFASRNE